MVDSGCMSGDNADCYEGAHLQGHPGDGHSCARHPASAPLLRQADSYVGGPCHRYPTRADGALVASFDENTSVQAAEVML